MQGRDKKVFKRIVFGVGGLALVLVGYNFFGAMGIEDAEECWYMNAPSGKGDIRRVASQCGLEAHSLSDTFEYRKTFRSFWGGGGEVKQFVVADNGADFRVDRRDREWTILQVLNGQQPWSF